MRSLVVAILVGIAASSAGAELQITHVHHSPLRLEPAEGSQASIHFRLSATARAEVHFWDGRDVRVRSIGSADVLSAGDHVLHWDGRDSLGRFVPPEAYHYTIEAAPASGGPPVVWDVSDLTGGEPLRVDGLRWDAERGVVEYIVPKTARVRIRIGLENDGPLLRTLVDWVPRARGTHAEPWEDREVAAEMDLGSHPQLALEPAAFALPDNTILVGPPAPHVKLIEDLPQPWVRRDARPVSRKRMLDFAKQPIEERRDFPVRLELPETRGETAEGVPIVSGRVPVRLHVDESDLARLLNQRFEAVFFLDGRFMWESEAAFFPLTWHLETEGMNPGVHYLSVNLRGYEGHFGISTRAVAVEASSSTAGSR